MELTGLSWQLALNSVALKGWWPAAHTETLYRFTLRKVLKITHVNSSYTSSFNFLYSFNTGKAVIFSISNHSLFCISLIYLRDAVGSTRRFRIPCSGNILFFHFFTILLIANFISDNKKQILILQWVREESYHFFALYWNYNPFRYIPSNTIGYCQNLRQGSDYGSIDKFILFLLIWSCLV